jgi:hypothetical protein
MYLYSSKNVVNSVIRIRFHSDPIRFHAYSLVRRDERRPDRIIPLPHLHPYFLSDVERNRYYTDAVTDADFFGCRIWLRSRISVRADAD